MRIEGADLAELRQKGFDPVGFERAVADFASGRWERELVIDASRLAPPSQQDLAPLPPPGSDARAALERIGREAIDDGHVGVVVLNGGMATRFGGVVKGTVEVVDGRSFLDLKLAQVRSVSGRVPVFLMDSPATHEATLAHIASLESARGPTFTFLQPVGPRVTPGGELVREPDGSISTAGMGHGDVLGAFARGGLERLLGLGGRMVTVSNVDNLGAGLDPAIVGAHLESGRRVSVEVARRRPSDRGGMPVVLDGRPVLLEELRWPPGLDDSAYATFNTNTFVIDASVFADPPVLDAYPVEKEVAGLRVLQFERILGEVTHLVDTCFIVVPVTGGESRFIPIKKRQDLETSRDQIVASLKRWGVL
jgi:UTP--glucose-1-phosphate uridylyltransferase